MHAAPPVAYPSVSVRSIRLTLCGVVCLAVLAWQQSAAPAWVGALSFLLGLALVLGVCLGCTPRAPVLLRWDGVTWSLSGAAVLQSEGAPQCVFDVGGLMLLRWRFHGAPSLRPLWLVLAQASQPTAWHGLRVAVLAWRPVARSEPSGQGGVLP